MMHLEKPYLNWLGKSKKKQGAKAAKAQVNHDAWLRERGLHPDQLKNRKIQNQNKIPDYRTEKYKSEGSGIGVAYQKGVMSNLHKETPEVRKAILEKAARCVPQFNKGGIQYTTPETDITTIGSKSRRG